MNESSSSTVTGIISSRLTSGSISYYPGTKRLIFSNVVLDKDLSGGALIETDISGLSIEFVGTNSIKIPYMFLDSEYSMMMISVNCVTQKAEA